MSLTRSNSVQSQPIELAVGIVDTQIMPGDLPRDLIDAIFGIGLIRAERISKTLWIGDEAWPLACEDYLRSACAVMLEKPVWYRTMDRATDSVNNLAGCDHNLSESNPAFGLRGIRRSLMYKEIFARELASIVEVRKTYPNLHILFPFVHSPEQFREAMNVACDCGYDGRFGIMAEVPAVLPQIDRFVQMGAQYIVFGMNDLTDGFFCLSRQNDTTFDLRRSLDLSPLKATLAWAMREKAPSSTFALATASPDLVHELISDLPLDLLILDPDTLAGELLRRARPVEALKEGATE